MTTLSSRLRTLRGHRSLPVLRDRLLFVYDFLMEGKHTIKCNLTGPRLDQYVREGNLPPEVDLALVVHEIQRRERSMLRTQPDGTTIIVPDKHSTFFTPNPKPLPVAEAEAATFDVYHLFRTERNSRKPVKEKKSKT